MRKAITGTRLSLRVVGADPDQWDAIDHDQGILDGDFGHDSKPSQRDGERDPKR